MILTGYVPPYSVRISPVKTTNGEITVSCVYQEKSSRTMRGENQYGDA